MEWFRLSYASYIKAANPADVALLRICLQEALQAASKGELPPDYHPADVVAKTLGASRHIAAQLRVCASGTLNAQ
jgi:hypothetical protein